MDWISRQDSSPHVWCADPILAVKSVRSTLKFPQTHTHRHTWHKQRQQQFEVKYRKKRWPLKKSTLNCFFPLSRYRACSCRGIIVALEKNISSAHQKICDNIINIGCSSSSSKQSHILGSVQRTHHRIHIGTNGRIGLEATACLLKNWGLTLGCGAVFFFFFFFSKQNMNNMLRVLFGTGCVNFRFRR